MKNFKITQSITDRQDASLKMFFKEVSKIPMIDINKEIELSRKAQKGDIVSINKLVEANLRFVISVAKQYQNKGLPLVDLIQIGAEGCLEAARRYDESKGFRFISYAVWWIRQAIVKALSEQCRTVRVPMNQIAYFNKISKVTDKFEQENNRKPFPEEIEEETQLPVNKIVSTLLSSNRSISLETPFKDDDSGCLLDVLPNCENTDNDIIQSDISKELEDILNNLSFRERDIIRMSFGLGMSPMQNEEIASRFGVTCERIRQIQNETIKRLRKEYSKELRELL